MAVVKRKRLAVIASLLFLGFVPKCADSAYGLGNYEPCTTGWIPGNQSEPGYDGHNVRPDGTLVDCVVVAPQSPTTTVVVVTVPVPTSIVIVPSAPSQTPIVAPMVPPVVDTPVQTTVTNVPVVTTETPTEIPSRARVMKKELPPTL